MGAVVPSCSIGDAVGIGAECSGVARVGCSRVAGFEEIGYIDTDNEEVVVPTVTDRSGYISLNYPKY